MRNRLRLLTVFAFWSYKVGFTFANVRSKEWRADSTVHAFGNFPLTKEDKDTK